MKSLLTIEHGTQDISSLNKYESRYKKVAARYEGFIRPPYSGLFMLMVNLDDVGEVWMSEGQQNRTNSEMVRSMSNQYSLINSHFERLKN